MLIIYELTDCIFTQQVQSGWCSISFKRKVPLIQKMKSVIYEIGILHKNISKNFIASVIQVTRK